MQILKVNEFFSGKSVFHKGPILYAIGQGAHDQNVNPTKWNRTTNIWEFYNLPLLKMSPLEYKLSC